MSKNVNNGKPKTKGSNAKGTSVISKTEATRVTLPVAETKINISRAPRLQSLRNGDIIVSHREYITDVIGTTGTFALGSRGISPSNSGAFPWLSKIARNYESYLFEKLTFYYESSCSTSSTGYVALCVDYDATDEYPTSKLEVMANRASVRTSPWAHCVLQCDRKDIQKRKTYYTDFSNNVDCSTGNFHYVTGGQATSDTVGEVYAEYTIRLMTPQPSTSSSIGWTTVTGLSAANLFGTSFQFAGDSILSSSPTPGQLIIIGQFEGLLTLNITGATITGVPTLVLVSGPGSISLIYSVISSGATTAIAVYRVQLSSRSIISASAVAGTLSSFTGRFASGKYSVLL